MTRSYYNGEDRPSQRRKLNYTNDSSSDAPNHHHANAGDASATPDAETALIIAELQKVKADMLRQQQLQQQQQRSGGGGGDEGEDSSSYAPEGEVAQSSRVRALKSSDTSPGKTSKGTGGAYNFNSNHTHSWTPEVTKDFVVALSKDVVLSQVAQHGYVAGSLGEQLRRHVATRRDTMVRQLWPEAQLSRSAISNKLNRLVETYLVVKKSLSKEGAERPTSEWKANSRDWDKIQARDNQGSKHWWPIWHDVIAIRNCSITEIVHDGVKYTSSVKLVETPPPLPTPSPAPAASSSKTKDRELIRQQAEAYDAERLARKRKEEEFALEQQRYEQEEEQQGLAGTGQLFHNKWPMDRSIALVGLLAKDPLLSQHVMKKHLPRNFRGLSLAPGDTLVAHRLNLGNTTWPERKPTDNAIKRKLDAMRTAYEGVQNALSKQGARTPTSQWPADTTDWDATQTSDNQYTPMWWCQWHNEVFLRNSRVTDIRSDGTFIYDDEGGASSSASSAEPEAEPEPAPKSKPAPAPAPTAPRTRARTLIAPSESSGPGEPMANERSKSTSAPRAAAEAERESASATARKVDDMDMRLRGLEVKVDRILYLLEAQNRRH